MPGNRRRSGLGNTARKVIEPVPWSTVTSENWSLPVCLYCEPSSSVSVTSAACSPSAFFSWPLANASCKRSNWTLDWVTST
ncbi:hypothetical protein D3C81_2014100 [compost metagenome]